MKKPVKLNIFLELGDEFAEVGQNRLDQRRGADAVDCVGDAVLYSFHDKMEVFRLERRSVDQSDGGTRQNDRGAEQNLASGGRMRDMLLDQVVQVMNGFRGVRDNFDFHCGFDFVVSFLTRSL